MASEVIRMNLNTLSRAIPSPTYGRIGTKAAGVRKDQETQPGSRFDLELLDGAAGNPIELFTPHVSRTTATGVASCW